VRDVTATELRCCAVCRVQLTSLPCEGREDNAALVLDAVKARRSRGAVLWDTHSRLRLARHFCVCVVRWW
jgi:hypothetical protein